MPSPFPGMDPYLEMVEWQDFHLRMMTAISRQVNPMLRPKYLARLERRIFVEHYFDETKHFYPDLEIVESGLGSFHGASRSASATIEPKIYPIALPEEHEEPYIVIKDMHDRSVVTVIELLSPTNKATNSDGSREYLHKRDRLLKGTTHLVEIDLLRRGRRPATLKPIPDTVDYCALVHRSPTREIAEVYEWTLRDPFPGIPIPLSHEDPDVHVNLQEVFGEVYEEASYDLELPYDRELNPPPRKKDAPWVRKTVRTWLGKHKYRKP